MKNALLNSRIILVAGFFLMMSLVACNTNQQGAQDTENETVEVEMTQTAEPAGDWIVLFDGETLDGWKRYNADEIGPLWTVEDGTIKCDGEGLGEGSGEYGGSLITERQFGDFVLELEWRISKGGNSGILYHVVEKPEYSHAYVTGPEYQVLDDPAWDDKIQGENKKAGASYDMYAPTNKSVNPALEWNSSKIVYNDGQVEHWLNGEKVLEFDENSQDFQEKYEQSKWTEFPDWNKYKEGAIGLQDHGAPVWFRNIRIREL
ncbi:MAG: 3-keto-disaccharide hydrolase [Candidatus Cyclobacteriaceae bacterium M3_2C_046]